MARRPRNFGADINLVMKKQFLFLAILLLSCNAISLAQTPVGRSKVTGIILDSTDRKPVAFASVSLINLETQKPINGAVADEKGIFLIAKVPAGKYKVAISFIGYETANKEITVEDKGEVLMGTVVLSPQVKELDEVTVEGKKDLIEERVDRTIYNADQDATTRGGDAADVLRRVPALTVDLDGNVSLRGNQNIRVLINNKPSTILASTVADALKQIPADQIKSVEVITSPSARYDAEGSAGIINIITKKNTLQGLTLGIDTGVGFRGSNLGLNGSYRKGKMGLTLGGFGRGEYNVQGNFENSQRTINTAGSELLTIQSADTRRAGLRGRYSLGFDYDIDKKIPSPLLYSLVYRTPIVTKMACWPELFRTTCP